VIDPALAARFWAKVDKGGPVPEHRPALGPCWVWTAAVRPGRYGGPYGEIKVGDRARQAHVVAWQMEHGPVPDGLQLDHLCRLTLCVRVSHLEPVTSGENTRRGAMPEWSTRDLE
jgi:hypothetical protein